jgi:lipopolysaccharide/colanic/teichoic acid biosynthesis glycosyltransferase
MLHGLAYGNGVIKRLFDVVIAAPLLCLTAPLWVIAAAGIYVSSGSPVLFPQLRTGRDGRVFQLLKFRTMIRNAPDLRNPDGSAVTKATDPRVMPFGRWLRRWSIDELPQLLNVLSGEMSMVGPRPELPDQASLYTDRERRRLETKPGLTGLAQTNGRNNLTWRERLELDVRYVDAQSLWMDVRLMLATFKVVLTREGVTQAARQ